MAGPAAPRIALDVHAHLAPVIPERLDAVAGVAWDGAAGVMTVDGHAVGMKPLFAPERLLAWMAENGVAQAWISAPPPLYRQHLQGAEAWAWADYLNAGLAQIAANSAGRLIALLHLPTQDPAIARAVAAAAIAQGDRHFAMPTGTGDERCLGDTAFEPLWAALDAAGAFLFLHPGECADGRLRAFYLSNLLGNPYESSVALAHLAFAGVPGRFPRMTLCFAHGGGLAPMVAGRWQRGHDTARPGVDPAGPAPMDQLRGIYVDCICHSEPAAQLSEAVFGADKVVFGSDWPFPMGLVEPHEQLAGFDEARRERYLRTNPQAMQDRLSGG